MLTFYVLSLSLLHFASILPLLLDLKPCRDGHQMGSMEAILHPPATSVLHLTSSTLSSHQVEPYQRGLCLQSWDWTSQSVIPESVYRKQSRAEGNEPHRSRLQQINQPVECISELLGLHEKWNRMQWCLSNGMPFLDMSGFIDRITYRDYDTFVHTSELDHFFSLACGLKWVIENPFSRGSLPQFVVWKEGLLLVFFKEKIFKKNLLHSMFSPFFFTIFLTRCGEIHYEAAPFFILLWWRRERREKLSRIDNE